MRPIASRWLFTGVRQCGKAYVMHEFGTSCFKDVAYINLERDSLAASVFEMTLEPARIISGLSAVSLGKEIVEGENVEKMDRLLSLAITGGDYEWL